MVYFLMLYLSISVITNLKFTATCMIKYEDKTIYTKTINHLELKGWLSFPVCTPEDFISSSADLQSQKKTTKL